MKMSENTYLFKLFFRFHIIYQGDILPIQDLNYLENIELQIFASELFLLSNIISLKATIDLKQQLITNIPNYQIKKAAKFAASIQVIGSILFLILSIDEYQQESNSNNSMFLKANILSTIATFIRFNTINNDPNSFTGSEDID